jgi:hypothetical protein
MHVDIELGDLRTQLSNILYLFSRKCVELIVTLTER